MIRAFKAPDYESWLRLWTQNNNGQCTKTVTEETWRRLLAPENTAVNGLGHFNEEGALGGFVHYILHPVTGHLGSACYMQDLYVDPPARRQGIGKALVKALAAIGKEKNWARLYWLAEDKNVAAQALYSDLGVRLDFSFFVLPLNPL